MCACICIRACVHFWIFFHSFAYNNVRETFHLSSFLEKYTDLEDLIQRRKKIIFVFYILISAINIVNKIIGMNNPILSVKTLKFTSVLKTSHRMLVGSH